MPAIEMTPYSDSLDLLRRFAPTPFQSRLALGFADVHLETNDLSFLPPQAVDSQIPSTISGTEQPRCLWKLIRDVDARAKIVEPSYLMTGALTACTMGPACLIGADRERKEILAFIGAAVDSLTFQSVVLPALTRLTAFVVHEDQFTPQAPQATAGIKDTCNA